MNSIRFLPALIVITALSVFADDSTTVQEKAVDKGYRIEQPGTITFTVGVKIKGKVEKPQVVIFLPKEKSEYRELSFSYSFKNDLAEPLSFEPIVE